MFYLFHFALFLKGLKCHQRTPQITFPSKSRLLKLHTFGKLLQYEKSSSKYTKCMALSFPHCKTKLNLTCLGHKFQYILYRRETKIKFIDVISQWWNYVWFLFFSFTFYFIPKTIFLSEKKNIPRRSQIHLHVYQLSWL